MNHFKPLLLLLSYLMFAFSAFSQEDMAQKEFINEKIEIANQIIFNYNQNIENLTVFQEELKVWVAQKNNQAYLPTLNFLAREEIDIYYRTRKDHGLLMKNYEFQLFKLDKYSKELNELCIELKNLTFEDGLQYNVAVTYLLRKIEKKANYIAEITNDVSSVSLLNFKDEGFSTALKPVNEVVLYAKNVILAIRYNDKDLLIEFKELLDNALADAKKNTTASLLKKESKIDLTNETIQTALTNIYSRAENISTWAAQYLALEGEDNENEINQILQLTITEFNKTEDLFGCAYSFNKLLEKTPKEHMFYTEEPKTLYIERIKIPKKKKALVKTEEEKQTIIEDVNTLEGSMPNNLVMLMDVSISMKKSGKFPILIESIKHAVNIMRPKDRITLIAYSGQSQVLIAGASIEDKDKIYEILNSLESGGGSDLNNALEQAYKIAAENYLANGNNKLIIASDGVFGVSSTISDLVEEKASKNFSLSVFHYGSKNDDVNTKTLKNLASLGKGNYELIETNQQAINALMLEIKKEKGAVERFY